MVYGHILGCGTPKEGLREERVIDDPKYKDYWNENKQDEQLGIFRYALQRAGSDPKLAGTSAEAFAQDLKRDQAFANLFADTFAWKLSAVLQNHGVNCQVKDPSKCDHVVKNP